MHTQVENKTLDKLLSGFSVKQLQFAIRLGLLPSPDKLNRILSRTLGSEKEIKSLINNLLSMRT